MSCCLLWDQNYFDNYHYIIMTLHIINMTIIIISLTIITIIQMTIIIKMTILRMRSHPLVTASDHVHVMVVISAQIFLMLILMMIFDEDCGDDDFFTIMI